MIAVLLTVLKVIGIILAVILGTLLLVILAVLFVPVRYNFKAAYNEKFTMNARVSWLLNIFRVLICYDEEMKTTIKILFFNIGGDKNKEKKNKKEKKETKSDNIFTNDNAKENATENTEVAEKEELVLKASEADGTSEINAADEADIAHEIKDLDEKEKPDKKKSKIKNVIDKITYIYDSIKGRIKKFIRLLKDTYNKVNGAKEKLTNKIEEIKSMVNDTENRELVSLIISQLKRLFKEIKPKKYDINVHFGFEEPDVTGKVLMYIAVFYGLTGLNINIKPEFEEKIFEGDCYLKGRIRVITLLSIALKVYKNKRFKQIINK
ncbi:MAG: hypothetical protein MR675_08845 [Lachnospira sp.]|nr:hypothetical protein [Lachnospira sp.]MDD5827548.1 hypothetical protein [Lachnospira sp.]